MNIVDHPCVPGFNNSLDGGDCIKWRTLCDDLDAAELPEEEVQAVAESRHAMEINDVLQITINFTLESNQNKRKYILYTWALH